MDEALRVLVVEDDPIARASVARALRRAGVHVDEAVDAVEALGAVRAGYDVALVDVGLPDGRSGLDLVGELKGIDRHLECVVFTGAASPSTAVEAWNAGAVEFFEKPIGDWTRFHHVLQRTGRLSRLSRENAVLQGPTAAAAAIRRLLVGTSTAMEALRGQVDRLGPRQAHVLLLGPTGAGKTLVARALHLASGRTGPFEALQIAARAEALVTSELFGHEKGAFTGAEQRHVGIFERTAQGTVLLDEIGDLTPAQQALLLQVLEERVVRPVGSTRSVAVTSRIVAATNKDLDRMVREGTFRGDLLNRLGLRVSVPGLAERREDVPQLVYHFLGEINAREGLAVRRVPEAVIERLAAADWSRDNLRGLRNAVERLAIFAVGDTLDAAALGALEPAAGPAAGEGTLPEAWRQLPFREFKEAVLADHVGRYVRELLAQTNGNVSAASRIAGLHPPNFRRLMARFRVGGGGDDLPDGGETR